jgi:hypothetical protein
MESTRRSQHEFEASDTLFALQHAHAAALFRGCRHQHFVAEAHDCPTGQADCEMDGMAESRGKAGICLLACDAPMQATAIAAPEFIGPVAVAHRADLAKSFGRFIEPDVPPPRTLI